MVSDVNKVTPFLWFDKQAEQAAEFYVGVFDDARITGTTRYPEGSPGPAGEVMTVSFELFGQEFTALNGGPLFEFSQATSFVVHCAGQDEVDRYWDALCDGGEPQQCGWVIDRFGVTWQVVPDVLFELFEASDPQQAQRVTEAMLKMVKLEISPLLAAFDGV